MQVMRCIRAPAEGGANNYIADLIIKESNSHINKIVNVILFFIVPRKGKTY